MMKFSIVTPKGEFYNGEVDYVVIDGDNGQLALLENHAPIVVGIKEGFVKRVINNTNYFYMISGGIVEYNQNVINIIAQELAGGETLEKAQELFEENRKLTENENKRKLMDFTELEKELAKNIKEIKVREL